MCDIQTDLTYAIENIDVVPTSREALARSLTHICDVAHCLQNTAHEYSIFVMFQKKVIDLEFCVFLIEQSLVSTGTAPCVACLEKKSCGKALGKQKHCSGGACNSAAHFKKNDVDTLMCAMTQIRKVKHVCKELIDREERENVYQGVDEL